MNILITGGTGSLGTKLVDILSTRSDVNITILSRDAHKQAIMLARYPQIRAVLGDIRDRESIMQACEDQDIVVHAAAIKRVERGATDAREFYSVNIQGTLNVAEACRANNVTKALFISSDKACQPTNYYGATKMVGEHLWLVQNNATRHTEFSALRYGNVVESNGSVWHVWQRRLEQNLPLIVRAPEPTRFFLSLDQAAAMVINSLLHMRGGEIFVPGKVRSFSLWDLARIMQAEELWIKEPLGSSEKQHEILVAETEYVEPADDIEEFCGLQLWRIWPKSTPVIYETPPMFHSLEAVQMTGNEVMQRLQNNT